MILAVNVENTHTVFGCVNETGSVQPILKIPTDRAETEFGYAVKMKQVLELYRIEASGLEGAVISSVVPSVTQVMQRAVRMLVGKEPLVVGAGIKTGLHIAIDDPGTVASDLVATAVAVKEAYSLPCIIVDMGTATTLTVVDERGRYVGGAIYPGVGTSLDALAESAALLPGIEVSPPQKIIASNTVDSMKAGIVYGSAGAVDGILDRFAQELGREPAAIVATGCLAEKICPYCRHEIVIDEQLLLKGLGHIWEKNKNKNR